jgi:hypothetical protein
VGTFTALITLLKLQGALAKVMQRCWRGEAERVHARQDNSQRIKAATDRSSTAYHLERQTPVNK